MPYIRCGIGNLSTYCPDTPANWKEFNDYKAQITGRKPRKNAKTLADQLKSENQRLRELSTFLPGHEPDRRS